MLIMVRFYGVKLKYDFIPFLALSGDKDLELELDSGLDSFVKG